MKITAAVSWFDEDPQDLATMIRSLKGFADRAVFLDGPYALFPAGATRSPRKQTDAILAECVRAGLDCVIEQREHAPIQMMTPGFGR